jgi:hypothetical protein
LVGVDQHNDFVMTHHFSLWIKTTTPERQHRVWQG